MHSSNALPVVPRVNNRLLFTLGSTVSTPHSVL